MIDTIDYTHELFGKFFGGFTGRRYYMHPDFCDVYELFYCHKFDVFCANFNYKKKLRATTTEMTLWPAKQLLRDIVPVNDISINFEVDQRRDWIYLLPMESRRQTSLFGFGMTLIGAIFKCKNITQ